MKDDDTELETAFKVVAIMQTITEDLDESGKRAWRKMLGITTKSTKSSSKDVEKEIEPPTSGTE